MENDNLVSIIIPVYNSSKYLPDTIESIKRQTYENYEVIFIDDGSTDNSISIIEEYKASDNRVSLIKIKHAGPSIARNEGIKKAKGRYLTYLDSDDIWMDNKLEEQIKFIRQNDYAFVYCDYRRISKDGKKIGRRINTWNKTDYKIALRKIRILTIATMIDLNKIPKELCYMPNTQAEDTATNYIILRNGYVAYRQKKVLCLYRKIENSRSSNKHELAQTRWQIYRKQERLGIIKSSYYYINYIINSILRRIDILRPRDIYRKDDLQVLFSVQDMKDDKDVDRLIKDSKVNSDYLIINQNNKDDIKNIKINNENVIIKKEKGLSRSRNAALNNAKNKILLLSDDDIIYEDNYKDTIIKYHNKYKDADIICFYIQSKNKKRKTKRVFFRNVNYLTVLRVFSPEISFKKESVDKYNIHFDENFGAGAKYNRGEENILLYEALRNGLKVKFINKKIAVAAQKESSWFNKYDIDYFVCQGLVFKKMTKKHYKFLIRQFAIRKYFLYHKYFSFKNALKYMYEGANKID